MRGDFWLAIGATKAPKRPALYTSHAGAFSPPRPRFARLLTGLYSAFSNPVLERLEYGMADMRLIPRRRASIGTVVSLLLERQRRWRVPLTGRLMPMGRWIALILSSTVGARCGHWGSSSFRNFGKRFFRSVTMGDVHILKLLEGGKQ
jgi:hypothetical protein